MNRRELMAGGLAAGAAALCPCLAHASGEVHWTYEGFNGPEKWGELGHDFAACAIGREQSPIDLARALPADIPGITLLWKTPEWEVANNGHTIQVQGKGGGHALIDGVKFDLLQFHFHTPSEHAVDGRRFPMEVHFVHKSAEGGLAVIGVMMEGGGENALFHEIMMLAPKEEGHSPLGTIDPRGLVGGLDHLWRYQGSLTTPPCAETVLWTVLRQPVRVADADIAAFAALFPMNARPLQPLNRRFLLTE